MVTLCRLVDTRGPGGPSGAPALAANTERAFLLAGSCGIPPSARALALNVTVTQATAAGSLHLHPADIPAPAASTIHYRAGQTRANNAVAGLDAVGALAVFCTQPFGSVELVLDVVGYFQ